jgi:hypothetical protein
MTITYPLSMVGLRAPRSIKPMRHSVVAGTASPFTGSQQIYAHAGQWWSAQVQLPPMNRADAQQWLGFLGSLNGREGTFLMGLDPKHTAPLGIATGTPVVKGAAQTGNVLTTDGWTNTVTGILKAGDFIQLGTGSTSTLHQLLTDASSDGIGEAVLDLWPAIRTAPADNAAITISAPRGLWRLADNENGWDLDLAGIFGMSFNCIEAF